MKKQLNDLRGKIDSIDETIVKAISDRTKIIREIGSIKRLKGISPLDEDRRRQVIEKWITNAKKEDVSSDVLEKIYDILHNYSIEIEKQEK